MATIPDAASLRARIVAARDRWLLGGLPSRIDQVRLELDQVRFVSGLQYLRSRPDPVDAPDAQVFSQWGEDGIIDWLVSFLPNLPRTFVEIGVEDYRECNTRFLARQGWRGVAFEGSAQHVRRASLLPEVWSGQVDLVHAWVEARTIAAEVGARIGSQPLGVLSVDIDGMDFHVLNALGAIQPCLVVCEYNARFGPEAAVTIAEDPTFRRRWGTPSWVAYGMSLAAVEAWGDAFGYDLVRVNQQGTNAFLIRRDLRPPELATRTVEELWHPLDFTEYRDRRGRRVAVTWEDEVAMCDSANLVEVHPLLQAHR